MHVVLIDNDLESRIILASSLKRRGFKVDEFTRYLDASETLIRDRQYLFLIDPQTLDNSTFADLGKFSKQFGASSIIIISYDDSSQALENAFQNDVNHYIVKPFDLTDVLKKIQLTVSDSKQVTSTDKIHE
ncbi:MAG: response regulator [bacterium]